MCTWSFPVPLNQPIWWLWIHNRQVFKGILELFPEKTVINSFRNLDSFQFFHPTSRRISAGLVWLRALIKAGEFTDTTSWQKFWDPGTNMKQLQGQIIYTLWLCQNSYWKWPFIVDFPIKNGDFPIKNGDFPKLTTGWWLSHPSEKYESQWEGWHPIYEMENKKCLKPPTSIYIYTHMCVCIHIHSSKCTM